MLFDHQRFDKLVWLGLNRVSDLPREGSIRSRSRFSPNPLLAPMIHPTFELLPALLAFCFHAVAQSPEANLGLINDQVLVNVGTQPVRETYLANRNKLATQCGTQCHFYPNFAYIRELIHESAIGELQDLHARCDRYHNKTGYPMATGSAPDFIDWDLWVGPSLMHPFSSDYFNALN